ncbi:hypothetical protein Bca52824_085620 [Brassica carinata]|uniref:Uncharacterized protein n=1 Tax=Brassica carinata TaxID=52824 RepID=A0A8X7P859_BRACI|nr:hypothetical protein Bca52824_085620 [Brassica carinata]
MLKVMVPNQQSETSQETETKKVPILYFAPSILSYTSPNFKIALTSSVHEDPSPSLGSTSSTLRCFLTTNPQSPASSSLSNTSRGPDKIYWLTNNNLIVAAVSILKLDNDSSLEERAMELALSLEKLTNYEKLLMLQSVPSQPFHSDAGRAMARRRRAFQPPRRPLSFRICSSSRSRALFTVHMTLSWSKLSSISYFSGGSRLQFSLPSSTQRHQRHSSAGPASVKNQICEAQSSSPPYVSPRLESPLRHSSSIPPQVQLQASASDVYKPGVRGAQQLTRILDLEFCQLSRLCSPYVSSITTVAGLPTPLSIVIISTISVKHRRFFAPP